MKNIEPLEIQQTEDDVIIAIRDIATQIFDEKFQNMQHLHGIGFPLAHQCSEEFDHQYQTKHHSYTQRRASNQREECQSEWINYQDFQKRNQDFETKVCSLQAQIPLAKKIKETKITNQQIIKKQNKIKTDNIDKSKQQNNIYNKKNEVKSNYNSKYNSKKIKVQQKQKQQKSIQSEIINKIKLQNLSEYGFMKQTGKLKPQVVDEIYKKKQKSNQQQNIQPKKHFKTLQQLYQQKQPLYQKYLKQKQKKLAAIYQSRFSQQQIEQEHKNPIPQINRNLTVEGNFQQRLKKAQRKAGQNKTKIINQILSNSPFQPQLNNSKKYKQVQSKIKKVWSQKSFELHSFCKSQIKNGQDYQKVPELIIERKQKNSRKMEKTRDFNNDYRLKSTAELSNILEIQDNFHE